MLFYTEEELRKMEKVSAGDKFLHSACNQLHELKAATKDGQDDESILWFECQGKTKIAAVDRKWIW